MSDQMDVGEIMAKAGLMALRLSNGEGTKDTSDLALFVSNMARCIQILQKQVADLTLAVATHKGS